MARHATIAEIFNEPERRPSLAHAIGPAQLLSLAEQIGPEPPRRSPIPATRPAREARKPPRG